MSFAVPIRFPIFRQSRLLPLTDIDTFAVYYREKDATDWILGTLDPVPTNTALGSVGKNVKSKLSEFTTLTTGKQWEVKIDLVFTDNIQTDFAKGTMVKKSWCSHRTLCGGFHREPEA